MTREEAKTWLSIPREKLAVIAQNIDRHYDVIAAYANGADVQIVDIDTGEWIDRDDPIFAHSRAYRVKPSAQPSEPWKPKDGELFFCICQNGEVVSVYFNDGCEIDSRYVAFGNCFKTRVEAEAARERVSSALKGETLSKTETVEHVESLDGEQLTDGEKDLIRALRVSGIDGIFTEKNSCLFNGGGNCGEYTQYSDFVAIDTNVPADIEDIINALVKIRNEQENEAEAKQ